MRSGLDLDLSDRSMISLSPSNPSSLLAVLSTRLWDFSLSESAYLANAMSMPDADYDNRSLYPSQVIFPMAGEKDELSRSERWGTDLKGRDGFVECDDRYLSPHERCSEKGSLPRSH